MTKAKDLLQFAGSCDDLDIEKSQKDWKTMNNPFLDDRPLTNETLTELGFEKDEDSGYYGLYVMNGTEVLYSDNEYNVVFPHTQGDIKWKTGGSVRMLIEALEGDE